MIGSLLVVGWVAYNFLKNRRQPIFFHSPLIAFQAAAAALSRAPTAPKGTLYSQAAERQRGNSESHNRQKRGERKMDGEFFCVFTERGSVPSLFDCVHIPVQISSFEPAAERESAANEAANPANYTKHSVLESAQPAD